MREKKILEIALAQLEHKDNSSSTKNTNSEPSWFTAAKENVIVNQKRNELKEKLNRIIQWEERIQKLKDRAKDVKRQKSDQTGLNLSNKAKQNLIEEHSSLEEENDNNLIADFESDSGDFDSDSDDLGEEMVEQVKVIFASRTHSQLSQFVREVEHSPFGKQIRVCTLASRQQMCINPTVNQLKNNYLINERCLEMKRRQGSCSTRKAEDGQTTKKSKIAHSRCMFLNPQNIQNVRDLSLFEVMDIENLALLAKEQKACPYYASRGALSDAQLVVVPYTTLLHKPTREACGLKLHNSVVIIDEAHNLLETISSIHSVSINGTILNQAHWQLTQYQQRFSTRLSAKNLLYIKQLVFLINCLLKSVGVSVKEKSTAIKNIEEENVYSVIDFVVQCGFDHLNIHKLVEFCKKTKLPQKLLGFKPMAVQKNNSIQQLKSFLGKVKVEECTEEQNATVDSDDVVTGSPLLIVLEFIRNLQNPCEDGRILCVKKARPSKCFIKYLLLNPATLFSDFITEPRAVIVAGGTMQPLWEFQDQLFCAAGAPRERIATFSCGHVIPAENVLPIALKRGPSDKELDYSWANRNSQLDELYQIVLNIIQVVSGGVVCFLPSYEFEERVFGHWNTNGYIAKIESRKKFFREPRKASQVDEVLANYAQCIRVNKDNPSCGRTGAFLLCVVGGKLSEGINFSDDLARCVIVVGLPYPNSKSAELREKMTYLNQNALYAGRSEGKKSLGQLYYEALCFKAVNQSIGRAIRHRSDYAALILADARYARPESRLSLPSWIGGQLVVSEKFGSTLSSIKKFLHERRKHSF